jgi:biopolymer transport protein ExbD
VEELEVESWKLEVKTFIELPTINFRLPTDFFQLPTINFQLPQGIPMKMKGAKAVHYESGPNMTPLVDVVMVILIFLMLAGSFAGSTKYLMSKQGIHAGGTGNSSKKPDPNQPPDINIRIDVAASGFVAQSQTPKIGPTSSPEALKDQLDALREKMTGAGTPLDKLQIVLQPGRSVKYQYVLQVYQAALGAQFTKIAMATSH